MSKMTKNKLALLALAGLSAVASSPAFAATSSDSHMTVDSRGGLEVFDISDDNYWFKTSGRLLFDQVFYDANDNHNVTNFPSGGHIRSARVTLKGGVGQRWVYKLDIDLADQAGNPGRTSFGEAFIGYDCNNLWLAIGQVGVPFGLENWAAIQDLTFMEPSLPSSAFGSDNGLGLYAEWHGHTTTLAGTLYHPNGAGHRATGDVVSSPAIEPGTGLPIVGTGPLNSDPGSDDWGIGGRFTFAPVHDNFTVYHAGLSGRYEHLHAHANNFDYVANYEVRSRQVADIFTNIPPNSVKDHHVYGAELAGRWGPLLLQGEYMLAKVDRDDFYGANDLRNPPGDLNYHGYYLAASYVLTGETREYDFETGTFGPVHPNSKKGAWEIGVRHSYVDLSDSNLANNPYFRYVDTAANNAVDQFGQAMPIAGNKYPSGVDVNDIVGSVHSTTIGLTWWVNDNVKFMANYVRTDLPGVDVDALGFRGQVTW